jgi:hypothetical protein
MEVPELVSLLRCAFKLVLDTLRKDFALHSFTNRNCHIVSLLFFISLLEHSSHERMDNGTGGRLRHCNTFGHGLQATYGAGTLAAGFYACIRFLTAVLHLHLHNDCS